MNKRKVTNSRIASGELSRKRALTKIRRTSLPLKQAESAAATATITTRARGSSIGSVGVGLQITAPLEKKVSWSMKSNKKSTMIRKVTKKYDLNDIV